MDLSYCDDHQKIELFISCRSLIDRDKITKSDPYVIMTSKNNLFSKYDIKQQTEIIKDSLNPDFIKTFIIHFIFEVKQELKFEVYDYDSPEKSDFLGSVQTTVGEIAGSRGQILILDLLDSKGKKNMSKLIVRCEKYMDSNELYFFKFRAEKLINVDGWFSFSPDKSDPLLRFFKSREDGTWLKTHETEVIMDNLNPIWKGFELESRKLNESDHLRPFKIECWDWNKNGNYKFIGFCTITIEDLKKKNFTFELTTNEKKKKKIGTLICDDFAIKLKPHFLDYIRGGVQININLAIDFTGSNGIPTNPESLHAIKTNNELNQYQEAILKVGEILINYDYDKKIPVYGFGAKPHFPNLFQNNVSHCFPLTGDINQIEVFGINGIFEVYKYALNYIDFSGPTLIHPLIEQAKNIASFNKTNGSNIYNVLLILTDGQVYEMNETIYSIVEASKLPLSIIIVGIGNSDEFKKMEILDGDEGLFDRNGKKAERDIVQFVPFNKFKNDGSLLAQHILEEIPEQLVSYMMNIGKSPNAPIQINANQIYEGIGKQKSYYEPVSEDFSMKNTQPIGLNLSHFN